MADEKLEIEIVLDDGQIVKGFTKIKNKSKDTSDSMERGFSSSFKKISIALATFAASMAGVVRFTKFIAEYGKALAEVDTITQDLGINQAKLNKQLVDASKQFGTSAADQAKTFYQIVSAGVTDVDRANQLLIDSNKLAIGGLTSTAQAVDVLTSAVNAYGQENLSSTKASDILFETVKLGKVRVDELASSIGQVLPAAASLGVSFSDVSAGIAQLTTKGLSASEAITQLNGVFTAVLKKQDVAASLGPKVAEAFKLQALQTKGLTVFLKDLNTALGGSETKLVKLTGRAEAARAVMSLASDNFEGMADKADQISGAVGSADDAFQIMNATLDTELNKTSANFSAILVELGIILEGPLIGSLKSVNEALSSISSGMRSIRNASVLFGSALVVVFAEARVSIAEFILGLEKLSAKFSLRPEKAIENIAAANDNLAVANNKLSEATEALNDELAKQLDLATLVNQAPKPNPTDTVGIDAQTTSWNNLGEAITGFAALSLDTFASFGEGFTDFINITSEQSKGLAKQLDTVLAKGISNTVQKMIGAVANGQDAFAALGGALLSMLGDLAITIGQFTLAAGIAKLALFSDLTGAQTIAAGIGLIALGSVLKAIGGSGFAGGSGSAGAAVSGGGAGADPAASQVEQPEIAEKQTQVNVNLQGNLVDPQGAALAIAELLTDEGRNIGLQVS